MRSRTVWLLAVLGGATAVAAGTGGLSLLTDRLSADPAPAVPQNQPAPGDPPIAWLAGTLEEVTGSHLVLREGSGPRIRLERLAAGATSFLRADGGIWREVEEAGAGEQACAEAIVDGATFIALRVFLGARGCGPL